MLTFELGTDNFLIENRDGIYHVLLYMHTEVSHFLISVYHNIIMTFINTSIYKKKNKLQKKWKESRDGVPKRIQTRVVRMVTKVKGRPYFFVSSVFGCLFVRT